MSWLRNILYECQITDRATDNLLREMVSIIEQLENRVEQLESQVEIFVKRREE